VPFTILRVLEFGIRNLRHFFSRSCFDFSPLQFKATAFQGDSAGHVIE